MFRLIQKRRIYFVISGTLIVLGLVAMIYSTATTGAPLQLSIDFTGGSLLELTVTGNPTLEDVRTLVRDAGYGDATVQAAGSDQSNSVVIRTRPLSVEEKESLESLIGQTYGGVDELRFESVGPAVGQETARAAALAIVAAGIAILFFIAFAFRRVPNALRYGVCAIAKMFHDVIVILGVAAILGLIAGWELDSLFLTAMVTVVGFSMQDVIVVFDRIRENIKRHRGETYETIVNRSLLEILHRSLATQLNAMFVMVAIIFFGGATIRQFMIVMLVGMVTGTYSSLFFAVPLLVSWERGEIRRVFRRQEAAA